MILALVGALSWAVGTMIVKWMTEYQTHFDLVGLVAGQHIVASMVLVPLVLLASDFDAMSFRGAEFWGAVGWTSVLSSAGASLAFFAALKRVPAVDAAGWQFLVPVVAVLVELATGESPTFITVLGMVLAIFGVGLVTVNIRLRSTQTGVA
jgi:drug/metabolite transporter (DMT)-like permease